MRIEREVGEIKTSLGELHKKVDYFIDSHDKVKERLRLVEKFQYRVIVVFTPIAATCGAALKALIDNASSIFKGLHL